MVVGVKVGVVVGVVVGVKVTVGAAKLMVEPCIDPPVTAIWLPEDVAPTTPLPVMLVA